LKEQEGGTASEVASSSTKLTNTIHSHLVSNIRVLESNRFQIEIFASAQLGNIVLTLLPSHTQHQAVSRRYEIFVAPK